MKSPVWLKFQVEESEMKRLKEAAVRESGKADGRKWWSSWLRKSLLKSSIPSHPTMNSLMKTVQELNDEDIKKEAIKLYRKESKS